MDWTVNDTLYHRFLKWKLKHDNILDCELSMLPKSKNARRSECGVEILEWINMFHGACP